MKTLLPMMLTLVAAVGGCAVTPSDDVGETTEGLTNATPAGPDYVVELHALGNCTANVISQHYLLTAAHCFTVGGPFSVTVLKGEHQETLVYSRFADVTLHPSWVDAAPGREQWDLALVHLRGEGMGAGYPSVRIYGGTETPWTTKGPLFSLSGYGDGSEAPDGVRSCPSENDQTFGTKRNARFAFRGDGQQDESGVWQAANGTSTIRAACKGDSGGGWRLTRNDEDFLVAVQSTSDLAVGGLMTGTLVQPKMDWLQASATTGGLPLVCTLVRDHRNPREVDYYDCVEHPRTLVVLPHPPPVFGF